MDNSVTQKFDVAAANKARTIGYSPNDILSISLSFC